jgi:DNA-binding NtrC family response regulator
MEMVHFIPPHQRRVVMLAAQTDSAPALICGAAGTGRNSIARWIHVNGPRAARPFITAHRDLSLADQLPEAQGGTLVIPEIGEWPLGEQKVLETFLTTKSIPHPTGDGMKMLLNVRIICTSSQGLEGRAQGGLFNPELFKKLSVFRLDMPPLSKRSDEFNDIAMGIVGEITHELHKEHVKSISDPALQRLKEHAWPGNLRELRNVLKMAVLAAKGDRIEAEDLPDLTDGKIDFRASRENFERIYITELLKSSHWDIERAVQNSKMNRQVLLEKIQKHHIELPRPANA